MIHQTMIDAAKKVLERVEAADQLAVIGTPEHDSYRKAALASEWGQIRAILETIVRA